jgi:hypothetical protein
MGMNFPVFTTRRPKKMSKTTRMMSATFGSGMIFTAQRMSNAANPTDISSDILLFALRYPTSPPATRRTM